MSLFHNPWPHDSHGLLDILRWKLKLGAQETPELPDAPSTAAGFHKISAAEIAHPPALGWKVTWLGHASFLVQGLGLSLLIDPIFSDFCAPLPVPSLRRRVPPPCKIEDLPMIDGILLTHGHYDHLDLPTLRKIGKSTQILVAEGHGNWLRKKGFLHVRELAWHQTLEWFPGLRVTATPAQHFTARTFFDRNKGHWCGWLIEGGSCKLWHAGDSGYCAAFSEIGKKYGPMDLGMIPIGAYLPRRIMRSMHMNPEEAVQVFLETACRKAVAMHWGTFQLTDEPMGEAPILLARALEKNSIPPESFRAIHVGDSIEVKPDVSSGK